MGNTSSNTIELRRVDENINAESDRIIHEMVKSEEFKSKCVEHQIEALTEYKNDIANGKCRARSAPAIPLEPENERCVRYAMWGVDREIDVIRRTGTGGSTVEMLN